jgi:hypothetical protein
VYGPRLRNRRTPRRDAVGIRRSHLGTALDIMSPVGGARDPGVFSPSAKASARTARGLSSAGTRGGASARVVPGDAPLPATGGRMIDDPIIETDIVRGGRSGPDALRIQPSTNDTRFNFIACSQESTSCRTLQIVAASCRQPLDQA